MTITIAKYKSHGHVDAVHNTSGINVQTDAVKSVGGLGEYQTPVELLASSLAACALTVMGLQAERAGNDFSDCYAEVGECEEDMQEHRVTKFSINFHLKASFDEKLRKRLENFSRKGCFVGNTLDAEKEFTFTYDL